MNFAMWGKAMRVIPRVSKAEWIELDWISRWLISTRAAVLVMTLMSALLAGIFAIRDGRFNPLLWIALTCGLILAHACNNLFNDYTDYVRGVDQGNYYRALYGPQPLVEGFLSRRESLTYFALTGALALGFGLLIIRQNQGDPFTWLLLGLGAFFVLCYTWPLKHLALGELAVLLVWGPLMIGGGYYVLARSWNWSIVFAALPYAFGVTSVILGKHIDKLDGDRARHIHTLPALTGERAARGLAIGMILLPYVVILVLVLFRYFTPLLLLVFFALPRLRTILPSFMHPKPALRPADFPQGEGGWPLFFAPLAFWHNRTFGSLFVVALILDTVTRKFLPMFIR